jgi:hypothetical protein
LLQDARYLADRAPQFAADLRQGELGLEEDLLGLKDRGVVILLVARLVTGLDQP